MTLLELMLVTALLALAAGVVTLGWRSLRPGPVEVAMRDLAAAHARAIQVGQSIRLSFGGTELWFWPDGSATPARLQVALVTITVDPLTGMARARR